MAVPLNTINGQRILEDEDDYEPTHDGSFISIFRLFLSFCYNQTILWFDSTLFISSHSGSKQPGWNERPRGSDSRDAEASRLPLELYINLFNG